MFRVCRVFPPRMWTGARSRRRTRRARRRASSAAQSAALPPPTTTTSKTSELMPCTQRLPCRSLERGLRSCRNRLQVTVRRRKHRGNGDNAEHDGGAGNSGIEPNVDRCDPDAERGDAEPEIARDQERRDRLRTAIGRRDGVDDVEPCEIGKSVADAYYDRRQRAAGVRVIRDRGEQDPDAAAEREHGGDDGGAIRQAASDQ